MNAKSPSRAFERSVCETCRESLLNAIYGLDELIAEKHEPYLRVWWEFRPWHDRKVNDCCFTILRPPISNASPEFNQRKWTASVTMQARLSRISPDYAHSYLLDILVDKPYERSDGTRAKAIEFRWQIDRFDPTNDLRNFTFASSLQSSTDSEESTRLIRYWMRNCLNNHGCRQNVSPSWVPKRLLHLGATHIKLIETSNADTGISYATLSHCWGGDISFKLTPESYDSMCDGFEYACQDLPRSFREAAITAKRLDLQYLWIDCLCILQGPEEVCRKDWEEQSLQMKDVYTNGILNIGATAAASPEQGCFMARDLFRRSGWNFFAGDESPPISYRLTHLLDLSDLERHSLMRRAWVVQERFLASRMLHFGKDQLFWQCADCLFSSELHPAFSDHLRAGGMYKLAPGLISVTGPFDLASSRRTWTSILHAYCEASLSYPKLDKLRAIHGVAEMLQRQFKEPFHIGIFPDELPKCLCWNSSFADRDRQMRAPDRDLPSWSWASIDGPLQFDNQCTEAIQDLSVVIIPTLLKSMVSARDWLFCLGRLIPIQLRDQMLIPLGYDDENPCTTNPWMGVIGDNAWHQIFHIDDYKEILDLGKLIKQIYMFPICSNLFRPSRGRRSVEEPVEDEGEELERTAFLVLVQISRGVYRRIGAKRTLNDEFNKATFGSWAIAFKNTQPSLFALA